MSTTGSAVINMMVVPLFKTFSTVSSPKVLRLRTCEIIKLYFFQQYNPGESNFSTDVPVRVKIVNGLNHYGRNA